MGLIVCKLRNYSASSNPSPPPKQNHLKQWLAKVGYERMQEIANPEQSIDRARENWQQLGRSEKCLPAVA